MKPLRRRPSGDFQAGFDTGQRLALAHFRGQLELLRSEVDAELANLHRELDELREQRLRERSPLKVV